MAQKRNSTRSKFCQEVLLEICQSVVSDMMPFDSFPGAQISDICVPNFLLHVIGF